MTQLSNYDLTQVIRSRHSYGIESEQEIELATDEVIIGQDNTVDDEIEQIAEANAVVTKTSNDIDDVDNATIALESLIEIMESSIDAGGFNHQRASLANIALESITTRFELQRDVLSFGLEATDNVTETKSSITKAKSMLSALKSNTFGLVTKMYMGIIGMFGNMAKFGQKILDKSNSLATDVSNYKGTSTEISLPNRVVRRMSLDLGAGLEPRDYVKELQRLNNKCNLINKAYANNVIIDTYLDGVISAISAKKIVSPPTKEIINLMNVIGKDVNKPIKGTDLFDVMASEPYLGGLYLKSTKPTIESIETALTAAVNGNTAKARKEGAKGFAIGSLIYVLGCVGVVMTVNIAASLLPVVTVVEVIGLSVLGYSVISMIDIGSRKAGESLVTLYRDGQEKEILASKARMLGSIELSREMSRLFGVNFMNVKDDGTKHTSVKALNSGECIAVLSSVKSLEPTIRSIYMNIAKRQDSLKKIITVNNMIKKQGTEDGGVLAEYTTTYISQWLRSMTRFEADFTRHTLQTAYEALGYVEACIKQSD